MSEKRKDYKGRVLKTGESQRKDLIYQYRYTDIHGKRQTIYFKLVDVVPNDSQKRIAMTAEQQKLWRSVDAALSL